jgi:hypothetical protein
MSEVWYYADPHSNQQKGPLSLQDLKGILTKLPGAKDALVRREKFSEWKKAGDVPDLRSLTIAPPPLPNTYSNAQMPTWRIRWWWIPFALLFLGSIGNREGRKMMAWVSGERRSARSLKRLRS